jgi:ABC-type ATPase involved in cell division
MKANRVTREGPEMLDSFTQSSSTNRNFSQNLFTLDNVSIDYGIHRALEKISLTIAPNEIIFITGPSGAGKSTLLNVLSGDLKPSSGKVNTPNGSVFISQVFQDLKLLPNYSLEDNLWLCYDGSVFKDKKEFYKEFSELCRVIGISDRLHLLAKDANGGLKQKLAMVRALLCRPNVLLADEPTCSLDSSSSMKIFDLLNYYNRKRGLTIVWASHNKELVKQFPGKILHLDKGRLVYSGHACFI